MGTEVLRPRDSLVEMMRESPCRRRSYYYDNYQNTPGFSYSNPNPRPTNRRQPVARLEQKKREPSSISKRPRSDNGASKNSKNHRRRSASAPAGNHLVMEKVTILRRGEWLDSKIKGVEAAAEKKEPFSDMVVTGTDRLGPDCPEMVPKLIRLMDPRSPVAGKPDVYAGSAFSVSPAPSSLPLPSFSKKKRIPIDDSATRDLRRLLRLDF